MQKLRDVLDSDELDFQFELGISDVSSTLELTDCSRNVDALATHCTVVKVKAQIDQIVEDLQILGVYGHTVWYTEYPKSSVTLSIFSRPSSCWRLPQGANVHLGTSTAS